MTTILKSYHPDKDWDGIALRYLQKRWDRAVKENLPRNYYLVKDCFNKYGGDFDMWNTFRFNVENIKRVWKRHSELSLKTGSEYHNKEEESILLLEDTIQSPMVDGYKESFDLTSLSAKRYPELILFSHRYKIAGQADDIDFTIGEDGMFDVRDHKTTKIIDEKPKNFGQGIEYFKYPINNVYHNSYFEYALQLSGYALMLEDYGYKANELSLNHVQYSDKRNGVVSNVEKIVLPYLKEEVRAMFEHYSSAA